MIHVTQHTLKKWINYSLTGLLTGCLVLLILIPALKTLEVSLSEGGSLSLLTYTAFFKEPNNLQALANSIVLACLTVVVCGGIGTLLAFLVHYFETPFRSALDKILLIPIALPGLIIVFAFMQLYGESGMVTQSIKMLLHLDTIPYHFTGLSGILFVHAYTQYVYFYLNVSIAIRQIDASLIEAARNMGASKWTVFRTVILPFLKPALVASSIMTFMSGIGSFSAPSILGGSYRVLTVQILMAKANNYMSVAAMQVVVLTGISLTFWWMMVAYERKIQFTGSVRGLAFKPVHLKRPAYRALQHGLLFTLCLLIVAPVLLIFIVSFVKPGSWMIDIFPHEFSIDNYVAILTKPRVFAPFKNSILMALSAALAALLIGLPASAILVKSKYKVRPFMELLIMLPWTMPASAIAINTINAFNKPTWFTLNHALAGSFILLPIAYFISSIPVMVKTLGVSMNGLNNTYIEASKSLGANGLETLYRIIVPILTPGMLAGFLLVFIRSLGEYTLSAFLYTASNKPLSIAMVNGVFEYRLGLAMAYGALLVIVSGLLSTLIYKLVPNGRSIS